MNDENYKQKVLNLRNSLENDEPFDYKLSQNSLSLLYSNTMQTSISKLEKYFKCPFSYFLEYNLNLKDRKMFEILHLDIGNVFHNIFDMFMQKINDEKIDYIDITEEMVSSIIDELIEQLSRDEFLLIFRNTYRYSYYLERIKNIAKSSIYALILQLSYGEFSVFKSELSFGDNFVSKIIINIDDEKTIELTGKVDRVDIYEDGVKRYIKIIDYKSSAKKLVESEVLLGTQLQLLTYLDVLIKKGNEIFGGNQEYTYLPGGVYYFEIKNPKLDFKNIKSQSDIKKDFLREFRLSGLTNDKLEVVNKIDKYAFETGNSDVIKVSLRKDKNYTSRSEVYSETQFFNTMNKVNENIKSISKNIFDGNIGIDYKNAEKLGACQYCNFSAVCKKDI